MKKIITSTEENTRTPDGPKETGATDAFYVLGSSEVSAQAQHREEFLSEAAINHKNKIRKELLKMGLLPSQSGKPQTPPIVLLTTGDILIQKPEHYEPEVLDKLKDWNLGKVILMTNGADSDSLRIKELRQSNENLIAVSLNGQVFTRNQSFDSLLMVEMANDKNNIVSASPERSADIKLLRAVQKVLLSNQFIQKEEEDQDASEDTGLSSGNEIVAQESGTVAPSVPAENQGLDALAASPPRLRVEAASGITSGQESANQESMAVASLAVSSSSRTGVATSTKKRNRNRVVSNKGKIAENKKRGSWVNNKNKRLKKIDKYKKF